MTAGRPSLGDDRGISLVELLIATSLLGLALAMFGATLFVMQKSQIRFDEYSRANDEVHLAIQDLDRELRSGYVVSASLPSWGGVANGVPSGNTILIYTEAGGSARCVRWVLYPATGQQTLYRTAWDPLAGGPDDNQAPWSTAGNTRYRRVATDIVNGSSRPAFALSTATATAIDRLVVTFWVNVPGTSGSVRVPQEIEVRSELTPRNELRSSQAPVSTATGTRATVCL
ncbi:MAG: PilW family protein [Actinomycetota bacterium]